MPPRGVTSPKQKRQYEHIKDSELKEGRSTARAKQIAAATINKQRAEAGQTKTSGRKAVRGRAEKGGRRPQEVERRAVRRRRARPEAARARRASRVERPREAARRVRAGHRRKRSKRQMIFCPSADEASSAPRIAVMLRSSRIGFTSTRSSARSRPGVGHHLHHHVRLAIVEAALDRRADAGRDRRIADVEIERDVHAARAPRRRCASACSTTAAMPERSMSFIVKTCTPESRTISFSRSSRLRMPMSTVCSGGTFGEKPPMRESSAGSGPSSDASGMPWTLPLSNVAGVFMSPCASTQIRPSGLPSRRTKSAVAATEPAAEAVIAAEHERDAAFLEHRQRRLVEPLADARDLADVLLARDRRAPSISGIGATRSPSSTTVMPSAARRSPSPAMRNADGPMSTPRRLPPRSSDTPMMWTGRMQASARVTRDAHVDRRAVDGSGKYLIL